MEVQALLAPNPGGSPRRSVIGWDSGRLSMLLAVLETRAGVRLNQTDVYLNIAGGLRVTEPAADLAVAAAIASAAFETPTSPGMVYFGEVGLSGEVRQVAQAEARAEGSRQARFRFGRPAPPRGARQSQTVGTRRSRDWRKSAISPIWSPALPPNRPKRTHDALGDRRRAGR